VTLEADDGARGHGIEETQYQLDGGAWQTYAAPFVVTGNGRHTVRFRSVDGTGNVERIKGANFTIAARP